MKMAKTAVAAALVAMAVPLAACDDGTPNEDALKLPETIAGAKVSHRITTNQKEWRIKWAVETVREHGGSCSLINAMFLSDGKPVVFKLICDDYEKYYDIDKPDGFWRVKRY